VSRFGADTFVYHMSDRKNRNEKQ